MPHPYQRKLEAHRSATGNKQCECWDCLRAAGLTPKLADRGRFKQLYPALIYDVDPGGVPRGRKPGSGSEVSGSTGSAEDQRHLRHAIANREVI
jgi:hypothetical protein